MGVHSQNAKCRPIGRARSQPGATEPSAIVETPSGSEESDVQGMEAPLAPPLREPAPMPTGSGAWPAPGRAPGGGVSLNHASRSLPRLKGGRKGSLGPHKGFCPERIIAVTSAVRALCLFLLGVLCCNDALAEPSRAFQTGYVFPGFSAPSRVAPY